MLAEQRRRADFGVGPGREIDRRAHLIIAALGRVLLQAQKVDRLQMRIVDQFLQVVHPHRRDRNPAAQVQPFGGGPFGGDVAQPFVEQRAVLEAQHRVGEPLVQQDIAVPAGGEQLDPVAVDIGGDADVAVACGKGLALLVHLPRITHRTVARFDRSPAHMFEQVEGRDRFEHRHLDMLAFAGPQLMDDRAEHRISRSHARHLVGDRHRQIARRGIVGDARQQRGDAAARLDHIVIGRQRRVRTRLSETGAMDIDDVGLDRANRLIIEAEPRHPVEPDIVDEHVARFDELADRGAALVAAHVPVDRPLAAIDRQVEYAHAARLGMAADRARPVALGRFDLDHIGAHVGEDLRRIGAEDHRRHIGDADAFEHGGGGHHNIPSAASRAIRSGAYPNRSANMSALPSPSLGGAV